MCRLGRCTKTAQAGLFALRTAVLKTKGGVRSADFSPRLLMLGRGGEGGAACLYIAAVSDTAAAACSVGTVFAAAVSDTAAVYRHTTPPWPAGHCVHYAAVQAGRQACKLLTATAAAMYGSQRTAMYIVKRQWLPHSSSSNSRQLACLPACLHGCSSPAPLIS